MNLVLFEADELNRPLPRSDRRAQHVVSVLKRKPGDEFDAGQVNGPRGKATVTAITDTLLEFTFLPTTPPAGLAPISLVVGLPRPQTARDILRDATTLGAAAIHFVTTEKGEPSYAQSTLWTSGEWKRHVIAGAEQAFDTHVPEVTNGRSLEEALAEVGRTVAGAVNRVALDNYEATAALADVRFAADAAVVLAIGGERGWSAAERDALRGAGFTLVHLGTRVLRSETAVIAALAIVTAARTRG